MKLQIELQTSSETILISGNKRIAEVKHYSKPDNPFITFDYLVDPDTEEGFKNAQRIVDCVNALEGIDDVFEFAKQAKKLMNL